ncbi:MAG: aminotransferase class I/II-fold pyridoxal phosphate-dependent enzyme [Deltaproteobacteria bacterium]|nr:aminotransferase class I/II-fold pyridoxal phosphate-dependent enzyme [Deltaproteobacteria bacterium]
MEFDRIRRLPPYTLGVVTQLMTEARRQGEDIINLGMGNPDLATPEHIVAKLTEAAQKPKNHRYSVSRGIPKLRLALCDWYKKNYDVDLDFDEEVIATMGAKEGFSHLLLAATQPGDVVFVQNPTYPIHLFAPIIAGSDVRAIRTDPENDFFENLERATKSIWPRPKLLILSFPNNPTGQIVTLDFFQRVIDFAREHQIGVIHDFAYADLYFEGERPPSILQIKGAKEIAVEFYSLSKSYNMPGWRVGFCAGNREMIQALKKIKSYLDYGMFQPIQIAATVALNGPQKYVREIIDIYRERRDALCEGLQRIGWEIPKPRASMFVWAKIPEAFQKMDSLEFSKFLLKEAKVAVSPGIGFGDAGEGYVRFALVENEKRIRQAVRGIKGAFQKHEK